MVKASIRHIVLGTLIGSLTAMIPVARAAEPEAVNQRGIVNVEYAPDVDLPAQVAGDVRAAIEDVLAGRAQPGVPIDVTLEADAVVIRVGSLWRRVAIARWDYTAARTVALHALDLIQPAPEVPEVASANAAAEPVRMVADTGVSARALQHPAEPVGPWSLHLGVAGARGVHDPEPWMVSVAAGATWTRDWMRIGLEVGWDHGFVRHPDGATAVKYDSVPLRLVLAAQNSSVMAGVRGGVAPYRVTGQQAFRAVTPVIGPFLALPLPIGGRFRGFLVGGFDYSARHTELALYGYDTAYSTPEVAPYLAVVVEGALGP